MKHHYLSTACLHDKHDYCQSQRGQTGQHSWPKKPAECKFCDAKCECTCHLDVVAKAPDGAVRVERESDGP